MSKPQSTETQLRNAKSALRTTTAQLDALAKKHKALESTFNNLSVECREWKDRFDILLRKEPQQ